MIETFQARLEEELQSQTQEATSSGAEVDEHAITRRVLDEWRGHERGVEHKLKGLSGSASSTIGSRATCAPGSSYSSLTYEEFAAVHCYSGWVTAVPRVCGNAATIYGKLDCPIANYNAQFSVYHTIPGIS